MPSKSGLYDRTYAADPARHTVMVIPQQLLREAVCCVDINVSPSRVINSVVQGHQRCRALFAFGLRAWTMMLNKGGEH